MLKHRGRATQQTLQAYKCKRHNLLLTLVSTMHDNSYIYLTTHPKQPDTAFTRKKTCKASMHDQRKAA